MAQSPDMPGIGLPDFTGIRGFAFDIDGVFTDGGILCDLSGELYRTFDAKDGFGIRMATMNGYHVCIITGGRSGSIRARFRSCGLVAEDVYLGSRDKIVDFDDFCRRHSLKREEVLYIGDDIPDIEVIDACGIGVCPCDAAEEVRDAADYVSPYPGGKGCVRDAVEKVLKSQGRWIFNTTDYKKRF